MRFARLLMLFTAAGAIYAQTNAAWDSTGNSMLTGTYYFRQVVYSIGDATGDLSDAGALYGEITFDGNGNWAINGNGANGGAVLVDAAQGGVAPVVAATGTYAIGGSGYGHISSPLVTGDSIIGLVSTNGIFVGSSTDNANGYNDVFIAAKLASPAPTASSFTGSWTLSDFDPNIGGELEAENMENMVFTINPDGAGHLNPSGAITIRGYVNGTTQPYTQTASGLPYIFSNGAAVATFPSNGQLIYGQKYFYFSPDGNFLFGGAPNNVDMIVGVKTSSAEPALSGLYYQVGLTESVAEDSAGEYGDLDTYFGSFDAIAGTAPQTLLGHQRVNDFGGAANLAYGANLYDYTYTSPISISGNEAANSTTGFIVGDGGKVMITTGLNGSLEVSVSLQASVPTGTGVYLNPAGVVNSASFAPFTARIAPGELITMFGSHLADSTAEITGGMPATTTLGKVSVTIGGYPAPIFSVAPGQVSVIVPYEVTPGDVVGIQLTNDMGTSNVVTQYVSYTAPGVFTQCACGTGYGWIDHLGIGNSVATPGSPVSDANPAVEGETLAVGLTGLGTVSPSITDGAVAPLTSQNPTTNTIAADISLTAATVGFSGLLPGLAGEYQLNLTIPTTGITVGPNYLDVAGYDPSKYLDSYMSYLLLPIQATPPATAAADARPEFATPTRFHRTPPADRSARLPVRKLFSQLKGGTENQ